MNFVADIHNHLAVKTYLFNGSFMDGNVSNGGLIRAVVELFFQNKEINIWELQTDIRKMEKGGLNCVIASHYVPEFGLLEFLDDGFKVAAKLGIKSVLKKAFDRLEKPDWTQQSFQAAIQSIDILEAKVHLAQASGEAISIPKNIAELNAALQRGDKVFLHSVEGLHHLGRRLSFDEQMRNLRTLAERGVCYLTLAHFFDNDFVDPVEGLPPDLREHFYSHRSPSWKHHENDNQAMKHPRSEELINAMLDMGMIIDLTHSGRAVRDQVYAINNQRGDNRRPLLISHSGVQKLFSNAKHASDKLLLASDDDITEIQKCGGVIGIILFNYWLNGKEEVSGSGTDFGMETIFQTIEYIKDKTGSYENIAIGSDFDGMTDPPDDVPNVAKFKDLKDFLISKRIPQTDVDAIMGGNMLRVLKEGWR